MSRDINVTSFFSISHWINSENWTQKHILSGSIHSINKMSMLQAWALSSRGGLEYIGDFDLNTKTGEASDYDTESDLIHNQTGNGLVHTCGPVRLPLSICYKYI